MALEGGILRWIGFEIPVFDRKLFVLNNGKLYISLSSRALGTFKGTLGVMNTGKPAAVYVCAGVLVALTAVAGGM